MSSGTVLTRRTSEFWFYGATAVFSWGTRPGISETQDQLPFSKTKQEPRQDNTVPEASRLQADPSCFLHRFVVFPVGRLGPLWGQVLEVRAKEGWISSVRGRERRMERMKISIQASQWGYKLFIKSEGRVFSLYHLLLELWCNEIAFSQMTIEGSDRVRMEKLLLVMALIVVF